MPFAAYLLLITSFLRLPGAGDLGPPVRCGMDGVNVTAFPPCRDRGDLDTMPAQGVDHCHRAGKGKAVIKVLGAQLAGVARHVHPATLASTTGFCLCDKVL